MFEQRSGQADRLGYILGADALSIILAEIGERFGHGIDSHGFNAVFIVIMGESKHDQRVNQTGYNGIIADDCFLGHIKNAVKHPDHLRQFILVKCENRI